MMRGNTNYRATVRIIHTMHGTRASAEGWTENRVSKIGTGKSSSGEKNRNPAKEKKRQKYMEVGKSQPKKRS